MLPAIIPLLRSNTRIRDMFITMLRKAIHNYNVPTRKMGILGACRVLRAMKYDSVSNVSRTYNNPNCFTLSSYSLVNRSTQVSKSRPTMQDIITFEILNILSPCLKQNCDIKETLYKGKHLTILLKDIFIFF